MSDLDSLVEATVMSIYLTRRERAIRIEVSCVWENRDRKAIILSGIDDVLIDDLNLYNIFDRVTLFAPEEAATEINTCTSALFFLLQKRPLTLADLEWPAFQAKLAAVRSGKLRLIEIEPVLGASIVALAEEIRIEIVT